MAKKPKKPKKQPGMVDRFQAASNDVEEMADLLEVVGFDWPQALRLMERVGDLLGDTVKADSQSDKPLAFSAYEKGLEAYQQVTHEICPVRLAALVNGVLDEVAGHLASVEVVTELGQVWTPQAGDNIPEWARANGSTVEVRPKEVPGSATELKTQLEAMMMDERTRRILGKARKPPPLRNVN
ncbi:hypothetical protein [Azospirillum sp. SYSU D00513]|uniref:hypothetical protein n=1 Tax=Azospirillum sp. SYSU D00513 TaxID=2812561 RepID=UPI001A978BCB|nr:hypothetical protein [Azospirillum sp. SYSU D00513]